jgi:hypothetical protein
VRPCATYCISSTQQEELTLWYSLNQQVAPTLSNAMHSNVAREDSVHAIILMNRPAILSSTWTAKTVVHIAHSVSEAMCNLLHIFYAARGVNLPPPKQDDPQWKPHLQHDMMSSRWSRPLMTALFHLKMASWFQELLFFTAVDKWRQPNWTHSSILVKTPNKLCRGDGLSCTVLLDDTYSIGLLFSFSQNQISGKDDNNDKTWRDLHHQHL